MTNVPKSPQGNESVNSSKDVAGQHALKGRAVNNRRRKTVEAVHSILEEDGKFYVITNDDRKIEVEFDERDKDLVDGAIKATDRLPPGYADVKDMPDEVYFRTREYVSFDLRRFGLSRTKCNPLHLRWMGNITGDEQINMYGHDIVRRANEYIFAGDYLKRAGLVLGVLKDAKKKTLTQREAMEIIRLLKLIAGYPSDEVNAFHKYKGVTTAKAPAAQEAEGGSMPKNTDSESEGGAAGADNGNDKQAQEKEPSVPDEGNRTPGKHKEEDDAPLADERAPEPATSADQPSASQGIDSSVELEQKEGVEGDEPANEEASVGQPSVPLGLGYSAPDKHAIEKWACDKIQEIWNDKKNVDIADSLSLEAPEFTRPEEVQRYDHVQSQIRRIRKQMEHIKDPFLCAQAEQYCQKWERALRISEERMRRQDEEASGVAAAAAGPSSAHDHAAEIEPRADDGEWPEIDNEVEEGAEHTDEDVADSSEHESDGEVRHSEDEEPDTVEKESSDHREPAATSFVPVTPVVPSTTASEPIAADQPQAATDRRRPPASTPETTSTDQSQSATAQNWLYHPFRAYRNRRHKRSLHRMHARKRGIMPAESAVQAIPFRSTSAYRSIMGSGSARSFFLDRFMKPFRKQPEVATPATNPAVAPATPVPAPAKTAQNSAA